MRAGIVLLGAVVAAALSGWAPAHAFEVTIETPTHHLGDDNFPWGFPTEGGNWTSVLFDMPVDPASLTSAYLVFDVFDNAGATASINGTSIPIPDHNEWSWEDNVYLPFDPALLRQTGNTVRFQAPWDGEQWDDFMFRNVRITPEPGALALLVFGALLGMRRRHDAQVE